MNAFKTTFDLFFRMTMSVIYHCCGRKGVCFHRQLLLKTVLMFFMKDQLDAALKIIMDDGTMVAQRGVGLVWMVFYDARTGISIQA